MPAGRKGKRKTKKAKGHIVVDFDRAVTLFESGDVRSASRVCNKLLTKAPNDIKLLQLAAAIARRNGAPREAIALLDKARAIDPANAAIQTALGIAWMDAGAPEAAAEAFRQAVEIAPDVMQLAFNLGVALEDSGDLRGAADAYAQAVALEPRNSRVQYNHGHVLEVLGDLGGAERAYRAALEERPEYPSALNNLANLLRRKSAEGREEAMYLYEEVNEIEPEFAGAWCNKGLLLSELGRVDEARDCFARAHQLDPSNATAEHMHAALCGDARTHAPTEYVASLFDAYASTFETHLTTELDYVVPSLLGDMLERCLSASRPSGASSTRRGIDLGCGTGLFGVRLRSLCEHLVGVDLSEKMIDVSRAKGLYDELAVAEIGAFLHASTLPFDIIAAADVFTYCGDLRPLFAAVTARLSPGGLFAFSTETSDTSDVALLPTGRFAYRRDHVVSLVNEHSLTLEAEQRAAVRANRGEPIIGDMFVFRR